MFSSECFHGSKGKFPVGFIVWNMGRQVPISAQNIVLDVYDRNCEKVGTKQIITNERDTFLNKWPKRVRNSGVLPPFSSAITISNRTIDVRDKVAEGFLCSLMCCGNDMQHYNYVAILSGPQASAGSYSVVPQNFERSMILHTVRRVCKPTWDNDRDQFYQPHSDILPAEFVSDCVVWSAFAPSNNTASLKDVEYNGQVYQIDNQMFPFLLHDVKTWDCSLSDIRVQLFAANEDRFMARWLYQHPLSKEAQLVYDKAKCLYMCVYMNLGKIRWLDYKIQLWDMGWWQVKSAAKDVPEALPLLSDLKRSMDVLGDKILQALPRLGFIPPPVQPLN